MKSSHSSNNGGDCLEWSPPRACSGTVPIRDSKAPAGPALRFPTPAWRTFLHSLTASG
nr:DUF397 domain-containing protein [Streptomyces caatingaensis]